VAHIKTAKAKAVRLMVNLFIREKFFIGLRVFQPDAGREESDASGRMLRATSGFAEILV
jgi:hypothetical protein